MDALYLSILVFIILAVLIFNYKPSIMFDKSTGQMKNFGVGNTSKTIFYYPYVMIIMAIVIYFIFKTFQMKSENAF